jgi:hypothetical protein
MLILVKKSTEQFTNGRLDSVTKNGPLGAVFGVFATGKFTLRA